MIVCVYAICKNESKFVDRWMDSMREADSVYVLDTGSADDTAALLRARGAQVTVETISPWRFDTARNRSLELVPDDADICVCTDIDEYFHPGWRRLLEEAWKPGTTRAAYRYTWNFNPDGSEGYVFWTEKAHSRHGYVWTHPVHEVLSWVGEGKEGGKVYVEGMQLDHRADNSKSRSQYLPLLEQSVLEEPDDDRNMHYLGREYYFHSMWDEAIITLKRHLLLPKATWRDERCASMRYIARCYAAKGDMGEAKRWLIRAVAEAPHLREPYLELAERMYEERNWDAVAALCRDALKITERPRTYICEAEAWGSMPWDLLSLGLYYTGRPSEAVDAAKTAQKLSPKDERIARNIEIMQESLK
ncbi:MAG TPA: glycosyl transferase family 2 [Candidatus Scatomorpha gallistercoris]|nr:glycosyl transferase family 2 [Candidatus Scatomorpha gallistercoris]